MSHERVLCTNSESRPSIVWSVPVNSLILEFVETVNECRAKYVIVPGGACRYLVDAEGNRKLITDLYANSYEEFVLKATVHGLLM